MSQVEFAPAQGTEQGTEQGNNYFLFSPGHIEMFQGPDSSSRSIFYSSAELKGLCFTETGEVVPDVLDAMALEVANTAIPAWADFASDPADEEAHEALSRETDQVAIGLQVAAEVVQRDPAMAKSDSIVRIVGVAAESRAHLDPQSVQIIDEILQLASI